MVYEKIAHFLILRKQLSSCFGMYNKIVNEKKVRPNFINSWVSFICYIGNLKKVRKLPKGQAQPLRCRKPLTIL